MTIWADIVSTKTYAQAESPRWDADTDELLWVDLATATLHTGSFAEGVVRETGAYRVGERIGCAAPRDSGGWVVAADQSFWSLERDGSVSVIASLVSAPGEAGLSPYFNDGVCDMAGRFWAGTQCIPREPCGALYCLDADGRVQTRLTGVTVSNGICFSPDGATLYYIDTLPGRSIERFDVAADGSLGSRRSVVEVTGGNPDGMTIDDDGCLWVAVWDAAEVRRYSPAGELLNTVRLPAMRPTAVALVDSTLIISTASVGVTDASDLGGYLFAAAAPVAGRPASHWGGRVEATPGRKTRQEREH